MRVVDYRRGLLLGPAPPQGGDRKSESYQNPSVDFDLPDAAKRRYRLIVESWDWIVYPWLSEHNEWMVSPLLTFVVDDESCRGQSNLRVALRAEKQANQLAKQSWPEGQYGVIYCDPPWRPDEGLLDPSREIENQADPPWRYGNAGVVTDSDNYGRAERHYPTMTIDEISTYRRRQRGPKNRRRSSAFARSSSVSPFVGDTLSRDDGVSPSSVR